MATGSTHTSVIDEMVDALFHEVHKGKRAILLSEMVREWTGGLLSQGRIVDAQKMLVHFGRQLEAPMQTRVVTSLLIYAALSQNCAGVMAEVFSWHVASAPLAPGILRYDPDQVIKEAAKFLDSGGHPAAADLVRSLPSQFQNPAT